MLHHRNADFPIHHTLLGKLLRPVSAEHRRPGFPIQWKPFQPAAVQSRHQVGAPTTRRCTGLLPAALCEGRDPLPRRRRACLRRLLRVTDPRSWGCGCAALRCWRVRWCKMRPCTVPVPTPTFQVQFSFWRPRSVWCPPFGVPSSRKHAKAWRVSRAKMRIAANLRVNESGGPLPSWVRAVAASRCGVA